MKRASGIAHLKPFLPGLEAVLEDPQVSELMINGPGNVWVERGGRARAHRGTGSHRRGALPGGDPHRAARSDWIPRRRPILDARLDDGSRVAICTPPASPHVAMTIRRFGGRAFSAEDLVRPGGPPRDGVPRRPEGAGLPAELPGLGRHRLGQDHAAERTDRTASRRRSGSSPSRTRSSSGIDRDQLPAVRGRERSGSEAPVSIRDLVRHALRHRPDHIVVGEVRGGEAADLLQALNTGHGGSLTTVHANNAISALSRLASCAMQAGGALPWEVTCRGVVDGIHLVVHMTRREGADASSRRRSRSRSYDSAANRWLTETRYGGSTMKNKQKRSEAMESDEKIVRVETLDDFDRELARDGGEALEVPAPLAEAVRPLPRGRGERRRDPGRGSRVRNGPEEDDR